VVRLNETPLYAMTFVLTRLVKLGLSPPESRHQIGSSAHQHVPTQSAIRFDAVTPAMRRAQDQEVTRPEGGRTTGVLSDVLLAASG
jgi:hypothetical protein